MAVEITRITVYQADLSAAPEVVDVAASDRPGLGISVREAALGEPVAVYGQLSAGPEF